MPVRTDNEQIGTDLVEQITAGTVVQIGALNTAKRRHDQQPFDLTDSRGSFVPGGEPVGVDAYLEAAKTGGALEESEMAEVEAVERAKREYTSSHCPTSR